MEIKKNPKSQHIYILILCVKFGLSYDESYFKKEVCKVKFYSSSFP